MLSVYICVSCQMCSPWLTCQLPLTIQLWMLPHLLHAFLKDLSPRCQSSSSTSHLPNRLGLAITREECNEPERAQHAWALDPAHRFSSIIGDKFTCIPLSVPCSNVSSITSLQDSKMRFTFIMNEIIWLLLLAAKRFRDSPALIPTRSWNDERNIAAFHGTRLIHQSPRQSVHS